MRVKDSKPPIPPPPTKTILPVIVSTLRKHCISATGEKNNHTQKIQNLSIPAFIFHWFSILTQIKQKKSTCICISKLLKAL